MAISFSPIVGAVTGGLDFSNYFTPLSPQVTAPALADAKKQGAVLAWGNFLTITLNFVIVAWVLFIVVKAMNRLRLRQEKSTPELPADVKLLAEIRDILAKETERAHQRS